MKTETDQQTECGEYDNVDFPEIYHTLHLKSCTCTCSTAI